MDLHVKVVSFLKKRYPHSLFTVTLGENQDTVFKRIDSFQKGYLRGSPDLIIYNLHKHYTGFCILNELIVRLIPLESFEL